MRYRSGGLIFGGAQGAYFRNFTVSLVANEKTLKQGSFCTYLIGFPLLKVLLFINSTITNVSRMFFSRMGGGLGGSAKETTTFLTDTVVSCLLKHFRTRKNRSSVSRSRNQLSREIIDPQTVQNKFDCLVFDMLFIKELTSLLDAESNLSCAQFLRWHPFVKSSTYECFIITLLKALTLRNFFFIYMTYNDAEYIETSTNVTSK